MGDDSAKKSELPKEFLDAHHHFLNTKENSFQSFLGSLVVNEVYLPSHYEADVIKPLSEAGVKLVGSVHVECMPDRGKDEVEWVEESLKRESSKVSAIVASCDLTQPTAEEDVKAILQQSPKVRGIRWILDCVGPYEPNTATHVGTSRHDGIDYLRGSQGGYDGDVVPAFERGYALLEKFNLSFDLQCAPSQLKAAARLIQKYPNIPVCLNHLGKPRTLLGSDKDNANLSPNKKELESWREGMKAVAALPNVTVKISMLGYAVPGWIRSPGRVSLMKELILETVQIFGAKRCMVATNWWKSAAMSDADGLSDIGPDPVQFLTILSEAFKDLSDEDKDRLFCGTAKEFYRIELA